MFFICSKELEKVVNKTLFKMQGSIFKPKYILVKFILFVNFNAFPYISRCKI